MGEFKITDIVDQRLQHAAAYLDKTENGGNGNGKIDGNEVSVFGGLKLDEKGYIGEEYSADAKKEHAKIMQELGVEISVASTPEAKTDNDAAKANNKPATENTQPSVITANKTLGSSKNEPKGERNWVKDKVKAFAKNPNTINIGVFKAFIQTEAAKESKVAERNLIWNDALIALDAVPEVKTKKDVEDLEKTMEATLKAQGRWNDVTKEVAKRAKEVAKEQLKNEEYLKLQDQFDKKMEADKARGANYNFKQYLEDIKKGLGDTKNNYKKDAFKELENYAKETAERLNNDATAAVHNKKEAVLVDTSYKKTKGNKHFEELIKGIEIEEKRAVELETVSGEEIKRALGDELVRKLRVYMEENKNPDGTYNLSKLVTDVDFGMKKFYGADGVVNHHSDKELDERTNCSRGIQVLIQEGISDKEFKKIREFAKIKEQKKSRNFGKAVKKALPVLAEATVAGIAFGVRADQRVQVTIKSDIDQQLVNDLISQLGSAAESVTKDIDGTVKILVHQVADLRLIQGLLVGAGATLLDIARNLIFGMEEDERTCFNTAAASSFKTLDNLEKWLAVAAPDKKDKLIGLARMYVAAMDGDEEKGLNQLYDDLNTEGGVGSVLNRDECAIAKYNMQDKAEKLQNNKEVKPEKDVVKPENDGTKKSVCRTEKIASYHNGDNYQWSDLARMYKCLDDYNPGKKYDKTMFKARFMKVLQGISDKNYDFIRIVELTKKSLDDTLAKRGQVSLKNEQGFDYDEFMKYMGKSVAVGDDNKDVIAPLELTVDGESNCSRDLTRLGTPTPYKKKGGKNNPQIKINQGTKTVCEYTITDKNGTRKVTKEEYQKSKYRDVSGE